MPDSEGTILVVDDDAGLVRLVRRTLGRAGFSTAAASTGENAFAWLSHKDADMMLLDLKLPDMGGKDLMDRLERASRKIPFVVITGQGDEATAVDMMRRGALDYIMKDARFLELVPAVAHRALAQIEKDHRLAFAEKQARLTQTVVDQSYSGVLIFAKNGPDPALHYTNAAFAKMTGCSTEKLIGSRLSNLEAVTGPWEAFRAAVLSGNPFTGETQIRSAVGDLLLVDCTVSKVLNHAGVQTHWAVILRDVTERKELEREILEISDQEQSRIGRDLHDGLGPAVNRFGILPDRSQERA